MSVSEKGSGQNHGTFQNLSETESFLVILGRLSAKGWSDHRIVLKIITFDFFFVPQMHGVCIRHSSLLALPFFRTPEPHCIADLCT